MTRRRNSGGHLRIRLADRFAAAGRDAPPLRLRRSQNRLASAAVQTARRDQRDPRCRLRSASIRAASICVNPRERICADGHVRESIDPE